MRWTTIALRMNTFPIERLNQQNQPKWKSCSNRERRRGRSKCTISTTHHVATLSRDGIFLPFSSVLSVFVTRGVRHCSTLSSTMMASLISVVARDWALTEDSEGGCGRKSRERVTRMTGIRMREKRKGAEREGRRRTRHRHRRRQQRPITFLSLSLFLVSRDAQNAPTTTTRCKMPTAATLAATALSVPSRPLFDTLTFNVASIVTSSVME